MTRRAFIVGVLGGSLFGTIDLYACGDKFLRVGRSARFRRYAAVHPAAIVIYPPVDSTRAGIDELKAILKRAGHTAVAVERQADVSAVIAASRYDVVIADYLDAVRLEAVLQRASSHALLLPILDKPGTAIEAEAMHQYGFLIRPRAMTKYDALAEIDRLMESRSRSGEGTK